MARKKQAVRFPAKYELTEYAEAVSGLVSAAKNSADAKSFDRTDFSSDAAFALYESVRGNLATQLEPFIASQNIRNAEPENN